MWYRCGLKIVSSIPALNKEVRGGGGGILAVGRLVGWSVLMEGLACWRFVFKSLEMQQQQALVSFLVFLS